MQFSRTDADILLKIMTWRRDVRHFRSDPLSPIVVRRLMQAVELAPSVGNARPWRFVEIACPKLRAAVFDNHVQAKHIANTYGSERSGAYQELKLAGIDRAPWQLAVFCDPDPAAGAGLGRHTMPETLEQSVVMAIHTLWLAARAENVGMGMVSILDPMHLQSQLDVPSDWKFVAYICLGLAECDDDRPLLHRTGWQQNTDTVWLKR